MFTFFLIKELVTQILPLKEFKALLLYLVKERVTLLLFLRWTRPTLPDLSGKNHKLFSTALGAKQLIPLPIPISSVF